MFQAEKIKNEYADLIGWEQHHDTTELSIDTSLTISDSGEFYGDKHPALRLDLIKSTLPENYDLNKYLRDKVSSSTTGIFNDLLQYRNLKSYGKTLLNQSQLLNRYGWATDKIINEELGRFVGYQMILNNSTGLQTIINQIGLQFSGIETFNLYLYHSSKKGPLKIIEVNTTGSAQWDWIKPTEELTLTAFDGENTNGGTFFLGYYQDDILGNAINYTDFNWDKGPCGSCGGNSNTGWKDIRDYLSIYPFYVPNGSFVKGEMFDLRDVIYINSESYGLNLRIAVRCDLTNFFIDNKFAFKNLLAYKVTDTVLKDIKYSQQTNSIEENLKLMILHDIDGHKETKARTIPALYENELEAVAFNISGINNKCLPCEGEAYEPSYGVI